MNNDDANIQKKWNYLAFPINFLAGTLYDLRNVIENIVNYGIYKLAVEQDNIFSISDIAKQVIYEANRGKLTAGLMQFVNENPELIDKDYGFFDGYSFCPPDDLIEIVIDKLIKDSDLIKEASFIFWAKKFCKVGNPTSSFNKGKELYSANNSKVIVMVNVDILFDYYNYKKTQFQIVLFCGYCAIRSIIGKLKVRKTNWLHIYSRMFGFDSIKSYKPDKNFSELQKTYLKRYWRDKILNDLELSWGLKRYADHERCMWITFVKDIDHNYLAKLSHENKKTNRLKTLNAKKKAAKIKVMNDINH